jgi:hypothetical protein
MPSRRKFLAGSAKLAAVSAVSSAGAAPEQPSARIGNERVSLNHQAYIVGLLGLIAVGLVNIGGQFGNGIHARKPLLFAALMSDFAFARMFRIRPEQLTEVERLTIRRTPSVAAVRCLAVLERKLLPVEYLGLGAQRERWAAQKKQQGQTATPAKQSAPKKRRISAAGRKRNSTTRQSISMSMQGIRARAVTAVEVLSPTGQGRTRNTPTPYRFRGALLYQDGVPG